MSDNVLGNGDISINKTDKIPVLLGTYFLAKKDRQ